MKDGDMLEDGSMYFETWDMNPGCWIDGGNYNVDEANQRVVEILADWEPDKADELQARWDTDKPEDEPGSEMGGFAADEANDILALHAPEGYWVGWDNGDFGCWPIEEVQV